MKQADLKKIIAEEMKKLLEDEGEESYERSWDVRDEDNLTQTAAAAEQLARGDAIRGMPEINIDLVTTRNGLSISTITIAGGVDPQEQGEALRGIASSLHGYLASDEYALRMSDEDRDNLETIFDFFDIEYPE